MIIMSTTGTLKEIMMNGSKKAIRRYALKKYKEICDHCSREYLKELMKKTSSKPTWLCLRCVNQDARLKIQGSGLMAQRRKVQEFISQDSRADQSIGKGKKAQGSRTNP